MAEYKALKADFDETKMNFHARGMLGNLSRVALCAGGTVGVLAVNYGAPQLYDAISSVVEADMAPLSGPARQLYADSMVEAMDTMSAHFDAAVDFVWKPVADNIDRFKDGTLVEHHKEWMSGLKMFEIPVGEAFINTWDWAVAPSYDSDTLAGRAKPFFGVAAGLGMVTLAAYGTTKLAAKTLDGMAQGWKSGAEFLSKVKKEGRNLLSTVRKGVNRGIDAVMGRATPTLTQNPFEMAAPETPAPSLREKLVETLTAAGAEKETAEKVVEDLTSRIGELDRKVEALQQREIDLGKQAEVMTQALTGLNERLKAMESGKAIEDHVKRAVAEMTDRPTIDPTKEDAPTLH
jgi:hypothetical protein